jgi:hypothetical protein
VLSSRSCRRMLVALSVSCLVSGAYAAEPPALQVGSRVRASVAETPEGATKHRRFTGSLRGLTDTAVILETSRGRPPLVIPRRDITELELSVRRSQRGKGALIGLGVGALVGAILGAAVGQDDDFFTSGEVAGIFAAILAPVGALVGAAAAPGERWRSVPPDRARIALDRPRSAGFGFSITVRF